MGFLVSRPNANTLKRNYGDELMLCEHRSARHSRPLSGHLRSRSPSRATHRCITAQRKKKDQKIVLPRLRLRLRRRHHQVYTCASYNRLAVRLVSFRIINKLQSARRLVFRYKPFAFSISLIPFIFFWVGSGWRTVSQPRPR